MKEASYTAICDTCLGDTRFFENDGGNIICSGCIEERDYVPSLRETINQFSKDLNDFVIESNNMIESLKKYSDK